MDKKMLNLWLTTGYIDEEQYFDTDRDTPQGGVISATLLNVTLSGLEQVVKSITHKRNDKSNICVYADDFIITCASKEVLVDTIMPAVSKFLADRGLSLSEETENLIRLLNPEIRGWTNYHRHNCAKKTFGYISYCIFHALWWWAKRRHPNKGKKWIKQKYFRSTDTQNWIFNARYKDKCGKNRIDLIDAAKVPIMRYVKIKSDASPYKPEYLRNAFSLLDDHKNAKIWEKVLKKYYPNIEKNSSKLEDIG